MSNRIRLDQFSQEEYNLYYDILHAHMVEDVLFKYDCDEDTASEVAKRTRRVIEKSSNYYDEYWDCIEFTADEFGLKEKSEAA